MAEVKDTLGPRQCRFYDSAMNSIGVRVCGEQPDSSRHRHNRICGDGTHTPHYGCHEFVPPESSTVATFDMAKFRNVIDVLQTAKRLASPEYAIVVDEAQRLVRGAVAEIGRLHSAFDGMSARYDDAEAEVENLREHKRHLQRCRGSIPVSNVAWRNCEHEAHK